MLNCLYQTITQTEFKKSGYTQKLDCVEKYIVCCKYRIMSISAFGSDREQCYADVTIPPDANPTIKIPIYSMCLHLPQTHHTLTSFVRVIVLHLILHHFVFLHTSHNCNSKSVGQHIM